MRSLDCRARLARVPASSLGNFPASTAPGLISPGFAQAVLLSCRHCHGSPTAEGGGGVSHLLSLHSPKPSLSSAGRPQGRSPVDLARLTPASALVEEPLWEHRRVDWKSGKEVQLLCSGGGLPGSGQMDPRLHWLSPGYFSTGADKEAKLHSADWLVAAMSPSSLPRAVFQLLVHWLCLRTRWSTSYQSSLLSGTGGSACGPPGGSWLATGLLWQGSFPAPDPPFETRVPHYLSSSCRLGWSPLILFPFC